MYVFLVTVTKAHAQQNKTKTIKTASTTAQARRYRKAKEQERELRLIFGTAHTPKYDEPYALFANRHIWQKHQRQKFIIAIYYDDSRN